MGPHDILYFYIINDMEIITVQRNRFDIIDDNERKIAEIIVWGQSPCEKVAKHEVFADFSIQLKISSLFRRFKIYKIEMIARRNKFLAEAVVNLRWLMKTQL